MSRNIIEATEENFAEAVLRSAEPVLVDFWAEWCGPCRRLAPVIENVAEEAAGKARVVKVNVDAAPALAWRYGIQGIPTLILFKDGAEKERIVGSAAQDAIAALIDRHAGDLAARKVG